MRTTNTTNRTKHDESCRRSPLLHILTRPGAHARSIYREKNPMDDLDDEIDRELGIPRRRASGRAWLRRNGGHLISQPPKTKRPPLDFLESLVLSGVRDVVARYDDQPDVSMLETFQEISAALKKNYRGKNFVFDFSIFEKTAESISVAGRRWVAMRAPTSRRLTPTIRLTEAGVKLAAALPADIGTALEPIDVELCRAVLTKPRRPHPKTERPEPPRGVFMSGDDLTRLIAKAFLDALKALQTKQDPTNEGTTTTTITKEGTDRKP